MLGGDRPIENERHRAVIDAMAAGIRSGEGRRHLMTYHPCGEASSADWLKGCDYLDFHSLQSGHGFGGWQSHRMVARTLAAEDKPCLDAECFYEDFPVDFCLDWGYRWGPSDIRRRVYANLVSGALGHTYGHQSVWCFRDKRDAEYPYRWKEALHRPMALQMKQVNKLISFIDLLSLEPGGLSANCLSAAGSDYALVYPTVGAVCLWISASGLTPCGCNGTIPPPVPCLSRRASTRGKCVFTPPKQGDHILLLRAI